MTRVELAARAHRDVGRIDKWWRRNRPTAPTLFRDELADLVERLAAAPMLGTPYEWPGPFVVRPALMPRSRYCVYYSYDESRDVVKVRSVWHTSRGHDPSLR